MELLRSLEIAGVEPEFGRPSGALRWEFERKGGKAGPFDALIAAHALKLDAIIVTDNMKHFRHMPDLRIENWLRPDAASENGHG